MTKNQKIELSLDNPFFPSLLFTGVGCVGFAFYGLASDVVCFDIFFAVGFFLSLIVMLYLLFHWASMLEKVNFTLRKIPTSLLLGIVIFKLYIATTLIYFGQVSEPNLRFDAYGTSSLIILDGVANLILFPIGYFSTSRVQLRKVIIATYVFTTVVSLLIGSSKSSLFNIGFTILLFYYLRRKQVGEVFSVKIFSLTSLSVVVVVLLIQIFFLVFIYESSFSDMIFTILNRVVNNFDTAILGCMVDGEKVAPLNFFSYTFLSLLKRFDTSLYELDYFNVPQWLLSEVLNISREGRFGYPNDNLYVALHFGGFRYFALPLFFAIIFFMNYYIHHCVTKWHRTKRADPFQVAMVLSIPMAYKSIQEFVGLAMILIIFQILRLILLFITSRRVQSINSGCKKIKY